MNQVKTAHMLRLWTLREVRSSLTRYLAILAIVALGVGFFCGLKVTKPAMIKTANEYFDRANLYDYKLISSLGYDDSSVKTIADSYIVTGAEGSISRDVLISEDDGDEVVMKAMSLTKEINIAEVVEGRLPEAADECVVDHVYEGGGGIGDTIRISDTNDEEDRDFFKYREYKIVGTVKSPLYISYERGTSGLGNGTLAAYIMLDGRGFDTDFYTEIYATIDGGRDRFSDRSADRVEYFESTVRSIAHMATKNRLADIIDEYDGDLEELRAEAESGDCDSGKTYILTREMNAGFSTYEQNANIVNSVAGPFPLFFIMVAALVIITTMTRMVDEQRMQIGVMKALGYSDGAILVKFLSYAGSAAAFGAVAGYMVGIRLLPAAIWKGYSVMYTFGAAVAHVSQLRLAAITFAVSLACAMGATLFSCARDCRLAPAELIRPRAPGEGKRILFERIPLIWSRLSFLRKVSLRNVFRYRARFVMMLLGISGCTALMVAAMGIRTTVTDFARFQYDEVVNYDYLVYFNREMDGEAQTDFLKFAGGRVESAKFLTETAADMKVGKRTRPVTLVAADGSDMPEYITMRDGRKSVEYPGGGEAVVCRKTNKQLGVKSGDRVKIKYDGVTAEFTVSGICENYIDDYVYINDDSFREAFGDSLRNRTALIKAPEGASDEELRRDAAHISGYDHYAGAVLNVDIIDRVNDMMSSLGAVIAVVILSAGLLAFIVIYNLTNINIIERVREIATIKVLGFYRNEVEQYVFRENIVLTTVAALIGVPLGRGLLSFVVSRINVDMIFFVVRARAADYLVSVALTFLFAVLVNIAMRRRLAEISMTESLKSIE